MTVSSLEQAMTAAADRTGRFVVQWGAVTSAWCLRLSALGVAIGALAGTASQVAVITFADQATGPLSQPNLLQRAIGVCLTALVYGVAGATVGLATSSWLSGKVGRAFAISLSTSVFTVLFGANVFSTIIRILSGTHVTLGAVEFMMSSPDHFVHAAIDGYAWSVRGLVLGVVVFGLGTAACLVRVLRAPGAPRLRSVTAMVSVLLVALLVGSAGAAHATLDPVVMSSTPELAFAMSCRDAAGLRDLSVDSEQQAVAVEPGPPRAAEALWRVAVQENHGPRPNVLLVVLESVGPSHLGYEGYRRGVTPNLDALAKAGLRVRRVWTTATHSNYAQMAILSSLFPRRGTTLDMYHHINYPRFLYHDLFARLGYRTGTISSQDETWQGMRRFEDTGTPTYFWNSGDFRGPHIDTGTERIVPDEVTVSHVKRWLEQRGGERWSLYVNLQGTHFPYKIPAHAARLFEPSEPNPATFTYLRYPASEREVVLNRYDNALAYVDSQIGRIRNYLSVTGQLDNTLWVITADHGEMFHEHGLVTHGTTLYDAESRVPLVLHWPRGIAPGDVWAPVSHLDVMPTLAALVGIPAHPSYQGRSVLEARRDDRRAVFMNIQGLRFADGVVCYPWKLAYDRTSQTAQLFHLERDPGEQRNVASTRRGVASALAMILQAQVDAQLAYHEGTDDERSIRFQPRLLTCPELASD